MSLSTKKGLQQNHRHSDDRKITASLQRHDELMNEYIAQGLTREQASNKAFKEITHTG